ncbi:DUF3320 domain-containing protein [Cohnella fermenti]|nr:DUF3320 domain-containing protein [Cohnella fermenti]
MENASPQTVACEWRRYGIVNYAMQQNFVPIVESLELRNGTELDLREVTVRIEAEPEFAPVWTKRLDAVPAGATLELGPIPLQLSGVFLAELTERLTGKLMLRVMQGERTLWEEASPLTLLAYDQWGGLAAMPEMVAAFAMPNHPEIVRVLAEAAPLLGKWTGNPSFDAYQSRNPNRVRQQAAAVFAAIQARQVTYCVAPASFEEVGQRVRLPDAVFGTGMGNCLDLSLLYAACLEAIGLHPLVVFTKGHAFPGVWLIEETFSESVQDDVSLLSKRLASGVHEISVVEATLLCAGHRDTYQEAEQAALARLEKPDEFDGFIDLRRARASSIRPLPIRIATPGGWEIVRESNPASASGEAPEEIAIRARPTEVSSIVVTKQKQWERKLLDLTLRNSLLNFRLTKSALPLLTSRLGELEDSLAEGEEFQLLGKPDDWEHTVRSAELFRSVSTDHPLTVLLQQEFRSRRLRADASDRDLSVKAIHLYRTARASLEENGANTLYLAFGLLKWYESNVSELPRYAPVVLVPVELVRKSSRAGFVLRMRDEEPQINITLLEMLRQDFGLQIGGLDPLPRDERGIDLQGVFATVRHAVMNLSRWDVVESAILGLFSFSRFVMWNDIRSRSEDLAKNKVVASLMAGRMEWEQPDTFPDPARLDAEYAPDRLLLPISADSSQMTAVGAALGGNSFVLHGPPGTGKSQTITNLIASALGGGKTVLFVAEKMAALSVVQSRLEQIGLGPFCLELHSNKSTKKAVLDQLQRTLDLARTASPEEWKRQADRVAASRQELNGYVEALHRKHGFGASLYEAVVRYERAKTAPACVRFEEGVAEAMTPERLAGWADRARELAVAGEAAGHPHGNAWADTAASDYSPSLRGLAETAIGAYRQRLEELRRAYGKLAAGLGEAADGMSRGTIDRLREASELLAVLPAPFPAALLSRFGEWEAACERVETAAGHGKRRDAARSAVRGKLSEEALKLDAASMLAEWRQAETMWFLPKLLKQNRIYKSLRTLAVPGGSFPKAETPELLARLRDYREEQAAIVRAEPEAAPLLGAMWKGGEADWDAALAAKEWAGQLREALLRLLKDGALAVRASAGLAEALAAGREAFAQREGRAASEYAAAARQFAEQEAALSGLLGVDFAQADEARAKELHEARGERRGKEPDGARDEASWWDHRDRQAERWLAALGTLREWRSWRQVRGRAIEAGLSSLVLAYESGQLAHAEVTPAFERAWWKAAIDAVLAADAPLSSFSGPLFEEKIKSFRELSERFEKLTRQEIAARLSANVPSLQSQASASSEAGILLRAIRSGGRGMSLRKLFEQIPNLLNRLCPCILMSPMSVAQYLDPKYAPFDLVVFDEASQLPTSAAVGAMARGRNVIVVGDPKQLPPTSFFENAAVGDDGTDDAAVPEDLESILEDCLALGMPQEHLLWHYRSRHESLIAFSNRHFYENKLLTFPSPYERRSSVRWHPVDGFYDRGKTKQNLAEAERVVEEIARRLRDPELSRLSVGVVTFNSIQQTLIEDLLDEAFRKNGELERLAAELPEPIFVKNLENVQGDERDVILFSIGYGPDAAGKVVLNFGPLNREGGWRRLNVAVSRARHEMHVFSSLKAEHLDVSRTRATGVSMLRAFLEYAEKGASALGLEGKRTSREAAGLEAAIAEALRAEGIAVDTNVGTSEYRMDLAIVHPSRSDAYELAILCDGDNYKTGKTARDRESLREGVLRGLGWNVHRVWTLDWLDNPERETKRILAALERARRANGRPEPSPNDSTVSAASTASLVSPAAMAAGSYNANGTAGSSLSAAQPTELRLAPQAVEQPGEQLAEQSAEQSARQSAQQSAEQLAEQRPAPQAPSMAITARSAYRPAELPQTGLPAEELHLPERTALLSGQIMTVAREEGPISRPALIRRVLAAWGIGRSGARIERRFDELLEYAPLPRTKWDDVDFYWPPEADPTLYGTYRVPEGDGERRNAEDLPPEEIANAVKEVLFHQISLPADDLVRETVKLLGYSRTGAALDRAVRNGIRAAVGQGNVELHGERAVYKIG